eukprot:PhM_4_TR15890/c1_g3_i4/m.71976
MSGALLPPFVIWNGKEGLQGACVSFSEVVQYQTANHYISTKALKEYLLTCLKPHRDTVVSSFRYSQQTPYILLLDCCSVHVSNETMKEIVHECHSAGTFWWLRIVFVPANCTGKLQPMDVGVFNRLKPKLLRIRTKTLLEYCREQRQAGKTIGSTQTIGAAVAKPQLLSAVNETVQALSSYVHANKAAFTRCGITTEAL